jgi:hypothetical protein
MMLALALTDEQLAQARAVAHPIPWSQRRAYLERVAELLAGRQFGNGDVVRAAARAQRELLGIPPPEGHPACADSG